MTDAKLNHPGLFTPWAQLLCYECHGPKFFSKTMPDSEFAEHCADQPRRQKDHAEAICDECGRGIWVPEELAWLQTIKRETGLGELAQTGGMCAALQIAGEPFLAITALDGPFCVGVYPSEDAFYEGDYTSFEDFDEGDTAAVIAFIRETMPEAFTDE